MRPELKAMLFPNTPVEVLLEGDQYAIYVEGEWHSDAPSLDEAQKIIEWLVKVYADDWMYPSTRIHPGWKSWADVSLVSLIELAGVSSD
jgi:hypothetical protein